MPKMEAASLTIKISLEQIIDTGNIREIAKYGPNEKGEYPQEIQELAKSIQTVGQLQPVNVKQFREIDGIKQYELIAGFRRRAAFQYLCSIGEDYSMIDAKIVTGEKLAIQLIENIQREDLSAVEREAAIYQLSQTMKQKEIAVQLSKTASFVSIHVSAYKMRLAAKEAGIDLSGVETSTLSELLSVPEKHITNVLAALVRIGGTRSTARALAMDYKINKSYNSPLKPVSGPAAVSSGNEPPEIENEIDPLVECYGSDIAVALPEVITSPKPQTKQGNTPPVKHEPIEADHRVIDVNIVLTVIYDYIEKIKKQIAEQMGKPDKDGLIDRLEAAKDILALIHKELDK